MSVLHVTDKDSLELASKLKEYTVVDFHGEDWCVPCRRFAPHFERVAAELDNVTFVKVDIDHSKPDVREGFEFQTVPYVVLLDSAGAQTVLNEKTAIAFKREIEGYIND